MARQDGSRGKVGRRTFLRDVGSTAVALAAGAIGLPSLLTASRTEAAGSRGAISQAIPVGQGAAEEPSAGNWKTWVLRSGSDSRLPEPAPPNSPQAVRELAQLKQAQLERTQAQIDAARFWDAGPATRRWTEMQLDMIKTHRPNPPRASRGLALLHIAVFDAVVAAWHAKYTYNFPAPSNVDPTLTPALPPRNNPSYPSEHAVVAGAAAQVLKHLFPRQGADWFEAKAREAAASRVWAGVDWPSAVEQGLALGRAVADRVLAQAAADGANAPWDGRRPTGVCYWKPTPPGLVYPPLEPVWGQVRPWLLTTGDLFRPDRSPVCGSAEEREQMLEVYRAVNSLTAEQKRIASFWDDGPGTFTPPGHWAEIALRLVERYQTSTPRAARLFAYQGVAAMVAGVCVWDAKFAYWSLRPVTYIQDYVDPNWTSFITTPPFPGFVSGHSGFSGASATLLGYVFPQEKAALQAMAAEAALSRLYGGIHIRVDNEVGLTMGRRIGAFASARALSDDIEDLIGRRILERGQGNALIAKLTAVVAQVNRKNIAGAIRELQLFVGEVSAVIRAQEVQPLAEAATDIISQLSS